MIKLEKTLAIVQLLLVIGYIGLTAYSPLGAGHVAMVFIPFLGLIASLIGTKERTLPFMWGVLFLIEFGYFFMGVLK